MLPASGQQRIGLRGRGGRDGDRDAGLALDQIAAEGHANAITLEAMTGTSPYLTEHLNRFGSYELDLSKPPAPLPFELPPR